MNNKYVIEFSWQIVFRDLNLSLQDVLRHARLPLDLMSRKTPTLTEAEYFSLWQALEYHLQDDPAFPVQFARTLTAEVFSPPLFAAFCSPNLNVALKRIAQYKPLIGPLRIDITQTDQHTAVEISGLQSGIEPPASFIAMELVFMVQLVRLATRERIVPLAVHTSVQLPAINEYEAYFGVRPKHSTFNGVTFSAFDAQTPFLTSNDGMWSIFEPELNMRLKDLNQQASFRERVRATLMETLASGQNSMDDVARHLAISPRTLQRRLRDENTSFQKELDGLREELARNYLSKSDYSGGQIAFLLGYQDPNSFFRAFRSWTGQTPELVRADIRN